jgi:hypothetical protein
MYFNNINSNNYNHCAIFISETISGKNDCNHECNTAVFEKNFTQTFLLKTYCKTYMYEYIRINMYYIRYGIYILRDVCSRPVSHHVFLQITSISYNSVSLLLFIFSVEFPYFFYHIRFRLVAICSVCLHYFTFQFPYFIYLYLYRPCSCVSVKQPRISYFLFAFCLYLT